MSEHISRVRKLYKLILRLHRSLPEELRSLGDTYAKDEFKRHKNCRPEEARIFLNEWREYVVSMSRQAAPKWGARPADLRWAAEGAEAGGAAGGAAADKPVRPVPHGPHYGEDIPIERFVCLSPDQLLTMYHMHVNYSRESEIDEGIHLIAADVMNKKMLEAKKHLQQMEKDHKMLFQQGLLNRGDMQTIQPSWWIDLFDGAMAYQDEMAQKTLEKPEKQE